MLNTNRRNILATGTLAAIGLAATASQANTLNPPETETLAANPQSRFSGKVVLITGATSGIGETTAKAFAQQGANVFFCGRRTNLGQQVETEIRTMGGEATYMPVDVRKAEDIKAFVDACITKYGRLEIAFNNAGIDYPPANIADTDIDEFDDLMNTNARGVFLGMKYEIPHLLKTGGSIINNASIGGHRAFPNIIGY